LIINYPTLLVLVVVDNLLVLFKYKCTRKEEYANSEGFPAIGFWDTLLKNLGSCDTPYYEFDYIIAELSQIFLLFLIWFPHNCLLSHKDKRQISPFRRNCLPYGIVQINYPALLRLVPV
jgi:hypothetical protein